MKGWAIRSIAIALVVLFAGYYVFEKVAVSQTVVRVRDHSYVATLARTDEERVRGLSGTKSLAKDHAMLFIFSQGSQPGIWMKDMNYPIDILWLDSNRQVVYLVKNASPSSYPQIFQPSVPARYVIELPSGTIEKTGITNGDIVGLPSGV